MEKVSFRDISEQWKEEKRHYVKLSSYATYVNLLDRHILPAFGECDAVGEAQVQTFVRTKYQEGLSHSTIQLMVLILKMIARFGEKTGHWAGTRWDIRYKTGRVPSPALLTPRQHEVLLTHIRDHLSAKAFGIYLCLSTGIRIGEVCALRWEDLDTLDGVLRINKTCSRICIPGKSTTQVLVGPPKTSSSIREIPLSEDLIHLATLLHAGKDPTHYLLTGSPHPLEPRSYRNYYKALLAKLSIQQVKFHALRHSFATRCIEAGCDCKTVSEILGHANINTTLNLYVHPGFQQKKDCIEKLHSLMRG